MFGPGNSAARVVCDSGEVLTTEGGAMISMTGGFDVQTTTHKKGQGGILKGLKRMLSGENFFLNHYTAGPGGGEILLATTLPGDMQAFELEGHKLVVQAGSYVASGAGIDIDFGWQGFKSFLSGESAFWLNISGHGTVIINSFGAIYPIEVNGDYIVDTGHIVAFQDSLSFSITKAGKSWISSYLGGEGLVCKFSGRGYVWCQSHNASGFGGTLGPMLRAR